VPKKINQSPKTMDVAVAGKTAPSATSRPLIVGNHSRAAHDPMLTQADAANQSPDGYAEQAVGAPHKPLKPADESAVNRQAKDIQPLSATSDDQAHWTETPTIAPNTLDDAEAAGGGGAHASAASTFAQQSAASAPVLTTETAVRQTKDGSSDDFVATNTASYTGSTVPDTATSDSVPDAAAASDKAMTPGFTADTANASSPTDQKSQPDTLTITSDTKHDVAAEAPDASAGAETKTPTANTEMPPKTNDTVSSANTMPSIATEGVNALAGTTDIQEKTTEQLRAEQLEGLAAAGTYALPIGDARHRRFTGLLISMSLLIAGVVMLAILLDMELIKIPGVPHTNFFGK
jgi:hypothetical protein